MEILPAEIYPIILSYADFSLWRAARYVSRGWNNIIMNQCTQIWNFIREGKLPNKVQHGYVEQHSFYDLIYYNIFRYGNKVAQELYIGCKLIHRRLFNVTGSIYFAQDNETNGDPHKIYKLCFQSKWHKEFLYIYFDKHLNMKSIIMNYTEYFCKCDTSSLLVRRDILVD